ncbi:Disease resistance protein RPM1 [Vitis vinifera]|uniref:Disease resistance protein RPM1 n=1 Tax=Vitis vinifera TaxID=29760 RepID=A0A438H9X9_VITVI|nr:Disease resistance protein RPM1 [Vitis vinifera]
MQRFAPCHCGGRRPAIHKREDKIIVGESACKYRLASNQGPESCMGILALSYNDLPYYLKSCFLYCGIFPEDSEIKTSKLIQLWLVEGFIQRRGKEPLEDIAEDYLYELIHRSMIQVAARKIDGRTHAFSHHTYLYKVILGGKLELSEEIGFYPPNLLELCLCFCELKNDPMFILEKLPKLKVLRLSDGHMLERNWSALLEDSFNSKA